MYAEKNEKETTYRNGTTNKQNRAKVEEQMKEMKEEIKNLETQNKQLRVINSGNVVNNVNINNTKCCSECGTLVNIGGSEIFKCPSRECSMFNVEIGRDFNAPRNTLIRNM